MADAAPASHQARLGWLDALRGAALCGMALYHAAWDLAALGWPVPAPAGSVAWTAFGDLVAGLFLALSGIGLVLARPKGPAFALRRLATLTMAGLAVTAASLWFAPEAPIVFGILQCMAAADAIALAALRLPASARLALAAAAVAAPASLRSPLFDHWPLAAFGFAAVPPPTLDYRPLLPWLGAVLVGTLVGDRLAEAGRRRGGVPPAARAPLRWMGRHSLAIYLLHQPMIYGALFLIGLVVGAPASDEDPLGRQCRADCAATGAAPRLCAAACACTAARLADEARIVGRRLTQRHLDAIGDACRKAGG